MKKAELYRSIEGIKPDRSMKNRIIQSLLLYRKQPILLLKTTKVIYGFLPQIIYICWNKKITSSTHVQLFPLKHLTKKKLQT